MSIHEILINSDHQRPQKRSRSLDIEATNQIRETRASGSDGYVTIRTTVIPYAGRLGGNQALNIDTADPRNEALLKKHPDCVPWMPIRSIFYLRGFREISLWKAAMMEGVGTLMLTYITLMLNASPSLDVQALPVPNSSSGIFGTALFIGPLVGALGNIVFISLFIFSFGSVSGGHLNPLITIATFFCRLTTLPRLLLYIGFQAAGGVLGGLLVRASLNSTHWKIGGCWSDPLQVTQSQGFTVEFVGSMVIIFLAIGVGLDPRQASIYGPALAPILVGFTVGLVSLGTAFTVPGYGGAGTNPARCLGAWMGANGGLGVSAASQEFGYTGPNGNRLWIYWVAPIVASMVHACFYLIVPPWTAARPMPDAGTESRSLTKKKGDSG